MFLFCCFLTFVFSPPGRDRPPAGGGHEEVGPQSYQLPASLPRVSPAQQPRPAPDQADDVAPGPHQVPAPPPLPHLTRQLQQQRGVLPAELQGGVQHQSHQQPGHDDQSHHTGR